MLASVARSNLTLMCVRPQALLHLNLSGTGLRSRATAIMASALYSNTALQTLVRAHAYKA